MPKIPDTHIWTFTPAIAQMTQGLTRNTTVSTAKTETAFGGTFKYTLPCLKDGLSELDHVSKTSVSTTLQVLY